MGAETKNLNCIRSVFYSDGEQCLQPDVLWRQPGHTVRYSLVAMYHYDVI